MRLRTIELSDIDSLIKLAEFAAINEGLYGFSEEIDIKKIPDIVKYHTIQDPDYNPKWLMGWFNSESNCIAAGMGLMRKWKKGKEIAWIKFLYVHPNVRKSGLGEILLNAIIDKMKKEGVKEFIFGSSSPRYIIPGLPVELNSLGFFKKLGWKSQSIRHSLILKLDKRKNREIENKIRKVEEKTIVSYFIDNRIENIIQEFNKIRFKGKENINEHVFYAILKGETIHSEMIDEIKQKIQHFIEINFSKSWYFEIKETLLNNNIKDKNNFARFLIIAFKIGNFEFNEESRINTNDRELIINNQIIKNIEIIGFVAMGATNLIWLGPMGVKQTFRKRGIGQNLVKLAVQFAIHGRWKKIIIPWVNEENIKFYSKSINVEHFADYYKLTYRIKKE